jgi:O-succinylbenzoic acid--CoA ligase
MDGSEVAGTAFEGDLFGFVREWFGGTVTFDFQTSGSTGEPGVVTFTRDQLIASARKSVLSFTLEPGGTALVCLGIRYVAGKMMLVRAFVNDMKIIAADPSSNPLASVDETVGIDFVAVVPLQLQAMLEAGLSGRLRRIRTILVGGAPVTPSLRRSIVEQLANNVYITYGMTETLTHVALDHVTSMDGVFKTLPGVEIGLDGRGCLTVQSDIGDGIIITNDLGDLLGDGRFRWLGRYDNVINSGGIKIIPERIEEKAAQVFARLNIYRNYFFGGLPHQRLGHEVVLYIEGDPLPAGILQELKKELHSALPRHERPGRTVFVDFMYTETGKISRVKTTRRADQYGIENT